MNPTQIEELIRQLPAVTGPEVGPDSESWLGPWVLAGLAIMAGLSYRIWRTPPPDPLLELRGSLKGVTDLDGLDRAVRRYLARRFDARSTSATATELRELVPAGWCELIELLDSSRFAPERPPQPLQAELVSRVELLIHAD